MVWLVMVTLYLDSGPYFRYMPDGHLYASKEICLRSTGKRKLTNNYIAVDRALNKEGTKPATAVECVSQRITRN